LFRVGFRSEDRHDEASKQASQAKADMAEINTIEQLSLPCLSPCGRKDEK
jgi:hypothetical protein